MTRDQYPKTAARATSSRQREGFRRQRAEKILEVTTHARRAIEPSGRLGQHRWVVERTMSWLIVCRRLHRRYERTAEHFLAFVGIASALICYRRLSR
ncbi:transposase [Streptomyces sp. NPDC052535]|uniref:transposase n=1 Tax=Streptomyces sp. NPDC052535 TaxID=3155531 RepID=UPI00343AB8D2